jgi:uncharacterized membrane protein (UPF0127 family)
VKTNQLYTINNQKLLIISDLKIAENFFTRAIGLMGKSNLKTNEGLWIKKCSFIHTFFMKFPIDAVFVDQKLIVKKAYSNAKPWKHMWLGIWGSDSVFELPSGTIENLKLKAGDQLYVGH